MPLKHNKPERERERERETAGVCTNGTVSGNALCFNRVGGEVTFTMELFLYYQFILYVPSCVKDDSN